MELTVKHLGAHGAGADRTVAVDVPVGCCRQSRVGTRALVVGECPDEQNPFPTTNSRAGCGKSLPEMPASSDPSRKNMGRVAEGVHHATSSGVRATTFPAGILQDNSFQAVSPAPAGRPYSGVGRVRAVECRR